MPIFYWEMDGGGGPFEAGGKKPNKKKPSTKHKNAKTLSRPGVEPGTSCV